MRPLSVRKCNQEVFSGSLCSSKAFSMQTESFVYAAIAACCKNAPDAVNNANTPILHQENNLFRSFDLEL